MKPAFFTILGLLYFGLDMGLTWWFKRAFGKDDNFIGKNAPDKVQRFFGQAVYLTIAYYLLVFIYLLTGFDFGGLISNLTFLDQRAVEILGFALGLTCLLAMVLARLNLGRAWRVGLDHGSTDELVTTGLYRFVRNPYFTFFLWFQFSLFLIVPNAIVLCAFIQSALLLGLQVRQEELFLEKKYGSEYITYKEATGRFLPRFLNK